jgi:hypothetical protein
LIEQSPHAQAQLAAAENFGRALDALELPKPSTTLIYNLLGRFAPPRTAYSRMAPRQNWGWAHWPRLAQASLAAALAVAATAVFAFTLIGMDGKRAQKSNRTQASFVEQSSGEDDLLDVALDGLTLEASGNPAEDDYTVALVEVSLALRDDFENLGELSQLPLD